MHRFEVHSNESVCRKSGRLGLEEVVRYIMISDKRNNIRLSVIYPWKCVEMFRVQVSSLSVWPPIPYSRPSECKTTMEFVKTMFLLIILVGLSIS